MGIPELQIPWPTAGLRRLGVQRPDPISPLFSRQQEVELTCATNAAYSAFVGDVELVVNEVDTGVFPSAALTFSILPNGPIVPAPVQTEDRCILVAENGWTAAQCATGFIAQINAYVRTMHSFSLLQGIYDSMRAIPGTTAADVRILLPFGLVGNPTSYPLTGPGAVALLFGGIDRPLAHSLLGHRRHVFGVTYPRINPPAPPP